MSTKPKTAAIQPGLVDGVTPHLKDGEVVKAVTAAARKLGGRESLVVAVKNEAGQIYRYATITGMLQEMYLAERLEDIALVDETAQGARKPKGVWVVFGPGRDMSLSGILAELKAIEERRKPRR